MTTILGIETSCDETSVAIVRDTHEICCNLIATQYNLHERYGGVVPELASRAHIEALDLLVREAFEKAGCDHNAIDAVAVTNRPGLIGSLLIGVTAAKTLAWTWNKPLIGIDHIHAHATSAAIQHGSDPWPAVALVVSGGHTSLFLVRDYDNVSELGATIDDAAGEAFDKVAMILGLGFPGGVRVDKRARNGNPEAVSFPRTRLGRDSLDFSFSGLKTAVLYQVHGVGKTSGGLEKQSESDIDDLCASFSAAVVDVLVDKTILATRQTETNRVVVGGGVAANSMLRARLEARCKELGLSLILTPMSYCTDNAAMIAALGCKRFDAGQSHDLRLAASAQAQR